MVDSSSGVRLQKWLAQAGLCSRREGEAWIAAGRVAVNGEVVAAQGVKVQEGDVVAVDGTPVKTKKEIHRVAMLHKPTGFITSRKDERGRKTVHDLLGAELPRMNAVGRLDLNSEGLLLFTNDGELLNRLTHPRHEVPRTYRARARGILPPKTLESLRRNGVELEDGPTGPLDIQVDAKETGANRWYVITLKEGRNREVRRIFDAVGLTVNRLMRVAYGGIELGPLQKGLWRLLTPEETRILRKAAGFEVKETPWEKEAAPAKEKILRRAKKPSPRRGAPSSPAGEKKPPPSGKPVLSLKKDRTAAAPAAKGKAPARKKRPPGGRGGNKKR